MKPRGKGPRETIEEILAGVPRVQAIYVATRLGIPDMLRDAPRSSAVLASTAGVHPEGLHRLLRFLVAEGVFALTEDGRFAATALSDALTLGDPSGLRGEVLAMATRGWETWRELLHAVETGQPAAPGQLYQNEGFEAQQAVAAARAITTATEVGHAGCVVDLQCGDGAFLVEVLGRCHGLRGVGIERPDGVARARLRIEAAHLLNRAEVRAGDLLTEVPGGGGYYVLRRVLHSYDDAHGLLILANCQAGMPAGARLAIIEGLLTEDPRATPGLVREDLAGLAGTGGRERRLEEYRALAEHAGLRFDRVIPLRGTPGLSVIELSRGLL